MGEEELYCKGETYLVRHVKTHGDDAYFRFKQDY